MSSLPLIHKNARNPEPALIFDVAQSAGIEMKSTGAKRPIRCPFHEDRRASAFISARNIFWCSVCTPSRGWTVRRFARALNVPLHGRVARSFSIVSRRLPQSRDLEELTFRPEHAKRVWLLALDRAEAGNWTPDVGEVLAYLEHRGLSAAANRGLFGILATDMRVPDPVADWSRRGYRLLAPLYDERGNVVNVQARVIRDVQPKTLFPQGSRAAATVFATASGRDALLGRRRDAPVLLGEGLTDFLALGITARVPVIACPGTSTAVAAIGPWVLGRELVIATDRDVAGEAVVRPVSNIAYQRGASRVRRLSWPQGCKDACDVVTQRGSVGLAKFLEAHLDA